MKKLTVAADSMFLAQPAYAAPADGATDPGVQLERNREILERQRIVEQIA